jgi:excisionase family DNA binding protein
MKTVMKPTSAQAKARRIDAGLTPRPSRIAKPHLRRALKVTDDVGPFMDVVRRHVRLTPSLARVIQGDFIRLLQNPLVTTARVMATAEPTGDGDPIISTQQAADLVGVSRPYLVARIEAGDIPLYQQVGNQRRVLKSAVLAWHRREQERCRRALGHLGAVLDTEIFAG